MSGKVSRVFFAGSFNPFTKGHADIAMRLLGIFDEIVIGIGANINKPSSRESAQKAAGEIWEWASGQGLVSRVEVLVYTGLTAEAASAKGCACMARGVRNASDFDYEYTLAAANREAFGMETLLMPADPAFAFLSSTLIRDLQTHGRSDIAERWLPKKK